jgi:hypothetical protein
MEDDKVGVTVNMEYIRLLEKYHTLEGYHNYLKEDNLQQQAQIERLEKIIKSLHWWDVLLGFHTKLLRVME